MARTVVVGGKTILAGGSPAFPDVANAGSDTPQNEVLDPIDTNKSIAQFILEQFNIPFSSPVLGSCLPGTDIRNQDATTMLKLSLAPELVNDPPCGSQRGSIGGSQAGFAEVEIDEDGIGRFYMAGQSAATGLDIRYCVPTAAVVNPADLVIVRGYDPPPRREIRSSFDGLKNAEVMNYGDCAEKSCEGPSVQKYATISYDDPQLDQAYLDDVVNSYELAAFESLLGYIIDLDLPDGTNDERFGLKITFGDTTKEYFKFPANLLNDAANLTDTSTIGAGYGSNNFQYNITPATGNLGLDPDCTIEVPVNGVKVFINKSRFLRLNKFGREESDFIGVVDVVLPGRKVIRFGSELTQIRVTVENNVDLLTLQHGKNWNWEVDAAGNVTVELFTAIEDAFTEFVCNLYKAEFVTGPGSLGVIFSPRSSLLLADQIDAEPSDLVCNVGDSLGYLTNGDMCVVVERKRPSIDVFDPLGNAVAIASQFLNYIGGDQGEDLSLGIVDKIEGTKTGVKRQYGIRYTPVIIVDRPSPIAYASTAPLSTAGGSLPASKIIDQADGIVDSDPTTQQNFTESELAILQDSTNGSTIDLTFPFCYGVDNGTDPPTYGTECLEIAENFLALQTQVVETTSVILGPDSTPRLGDRMADGSVINEISYSYSDSSQYLITATAGPLFLSSGSFNDPRYQLQTEDVTREGTIIQDAGDGTTYVVRVEGFGEITALLMVLDDLSVGDKVQVRIYNNPVEKI